MCPPKEQDSGEKKEESREERLERIKRLISARGEDAANVLKMWLQQSQDVDKKKR